MNGPCPARKPFPWRRGLIALFAALVLAVLGFFGYDWYERDLAERNLARIIEQLDRDDPGWRLSDIEAARSAVPDAENGAAVVASAYGKLPKDWLTTELIDELKQGDPNERLSAKVIAALTRELRRHESALADARRLSTFDKGKYSLQYTTNPMATPFPHIDRISAVTNLLYMDGLQAAEERDFLRALRACRAMAGVGRTLGDEPLTVSLWKRCHAFGSACSMTEQILGQGTLAAEDMMGLQRLFEREDSLNCLPQAMRGMRALFHKRYEAIETGELPGGHLVGESRSSSWLPSHKATELREHHAAALEELTRYVQISQAPITTRSDVQRQIMGSRRPLPDFHLLLSYSKGLVHTELKDRYQHAVLRCTIALLASEQFRLKQGRLPQSIEELQDFAPEQTLIDPCDGQPLRLELRRDPERLVIYSAGLNGDDDGGIEDPLPTDGRDVVVRLWNVADRHRPPKPPKPPKPKVPDGGLGGPEAGPQGPP